MEKLNNILKSTKAASIELGITKSGARNRAVFHIGKAIYRRKDEILEANKIDIENAKQSGLSSAMIERLTLNDNKIQNIAQAMLDISMMKDPVGEIIESYEHPNKMRINKIRVPFGVVCAIYESRPNVTIDIACLCIKTGNACILRGGKEALNTNKTIVKVMKEAVAEDINPDVIALIEDTDRALVLELIQAKDYVDLVVPRGGKKLIDHVVSNAKVPFIETGAGNCHVYVDDEVDYEMALNVIVNAKTQRPSVCNAIETILINDKIKEEFLPLLEKELGKYCVEMRGCEITKSVINVLKATEEDFYQEYNDYIVAIKVVSDLKEAINHINKYGTKHSDCILTRNLEKAEQFLNTVDSACVYVNASTRFTDGGEFGLGAELGISTQKLHARGPMGLKEMTTYKYKIYGEGQVRK